MGGSRAGPLPFIWLPSSINIYRRFQGMHYAPSEPREWNAGSRDSFFLSLPLTYSGNPISSSGTLSLSLSSWPPASTALSLSPTPPPFGVRPRNGIKLGETRGNGEGRRKREEVAERERMRGWASPDRHYCCLEQKGCASFFDWMR